MNLEFQKNDVIQRNTVRLTAYVSEPTLYKIRLYQEKVRKNLPLGSRVSLGLTLDYMVEELEKNENKKK